MTDNLDIYDPERAEPDTTTVDWFDLGRRTSLSTETLIPRGATLGHIIDRYGPLPDGIPCGLANCHRSHQSGFVVSFTCDGVEGVGRIGHKCARNLFGVLWKAAEKVYTANVNAAVLHARARSLAPAIEIVLPQVRAAIPRLQRLRAIRNAIEERVPLFFRVCTDAVRSHQGYLGTDTGNGFKAMVRIEGGEFYVTDPPYVPALVLFREMEGFEVFLAGKNTPVAIERRVSDLANIEKRWQAIEAWMVAATRALRPEHLEPVCTFFTEQDLDSVRLSKNNKKFLCWGFRADIGEDNWVEVTRIDGI
jgi:hypothetical protein